MCCYTRKEDYATVRTYAYYPFRPVLATSTTSSYWLHGPLAMLEQAPQDKPW